MAKIEIVNTGNRTVSFWKSTNGYSWIFSFSAEGVKFIDKYERLYYEKKITRLPPQKVAEKKVRILPHDKCVMKIQFYINNRKLFLKTNRNLRVVFLYNDANLGFMEDVSVPKITSENTLNYKW